MKKRTVQYCSNNKLCCSCGFCKDLCPVDAIEIQNQKFIFTPNVDKTKCLKCGLCYDICSGKGNDWFCNSQDFLGKTSVEFNFEEDIGFYKSCYVAHSTNYEIRFHCASGGIVTSLLLYLLDNKFIDGAIVTRFKRDNPLAVETVIATTREEVLEAKSSKYCPVHMDGIIKQIKEFTGKLAFVGLPCQIQTLRNIEKKYTWLNEKIFLHLGLFCSGTKDSRALDFLLSKNNIKKQGIKKFAYRDEGCLGKLKASYDNEELSIPYLKAYSVFHSYFKPERCVKCIDHFSYLADISIGDIDCKPYNQDIIGSNSVVIRTDTALNVFVAALNAKVLEGSEISVSEIIRSQQVLFFRKSLFRAYRCFQKLLIKPQPLYDRYPKISLNKKGCIWAISYIVQRFLSKIGFVK